MLASVVGFGRGLRSWASVVGFGGGLRWLAFGGGLLWLPFGGGPLVGLADSGLVGRGARGVACVCRPGWASVVGLGGGPRRWASVKDLGDGPR